MTTKELKEKFSIVTGSIRRPELIFVIVTDDSAVKPEEGHLFVLAFYQGQWTQAGGRPWPAVATDIATKPNPALMALGPSGEIVCVVSENTTDENIPEASKRGTMRALRVIDGEAYAAGMDRQVYHRPAAGRWISVDTEDLRPPRNEVKGFEALDGFSANEIYAAGWDGEIWWFDGTRWHKVNSPTNLILTSITCAEDGQVYAAGRQGLVLRGRRDAWEALEQATFHEDIWSLRWFKGRLYLSGLSGVYQLVEGDVVPVDFGKDWPKSTYHLSTCPEAMISIGTKDIMMFNGAAWQRII